jgi:two-component system sensor kinase FixL
MCDHAGRLTFVNDSWLAALNLRVGEDWTSLFPELDRATFEHLWHQCMQLEQAQRVRYRAHKPGDAAIWYELHLQPAVTDDGERFMLGALIDITEQTLISAESHAILDTVVDAIIIINESGTIEIFNQAACRMFGYTVAEAVGHDVSMLMPTPHRQQHQSYIDRYLETHEPRVIGLGRELTGERKDGTRFPISLAVSEINLAGERRFTGIVRDLTEQHASRQTLAEQRERLAHVGRLSTMGEMTASIAHEINQPLTAISMYAQAGLKLLEHQGDPAKLKEALEKLNVQALRAGAVIERIQRFARAQDGVREQVDINALLIDLLKLAESDARLHDIQIELELDDQLPVLLVDPIQIQQVALNLIRNAIDAMTEIGCPHGRNIVMRSRRTPDGQIEVAVRDLGPGVADSQVDLLFTPFHTTKHDGMGMGLSICRSIISEHGGALSYFNNEGPGATFFFRLPIRQDG